MKITRLLPTTNALVTAVLLCSSCSREEQTRTTTLGQLTSTTVQLANSPTPGSQSNATNHDATHLQSSSATYDESHYRMYELASDPDSPLKYDTNLSEFQLVYSQRSPDPRTKITVTIPLEYDPWTGTKLPPSKRPIYAGEHCLRAYAY